MNFNRNKKIISATLCLLLSLGIIMPHLAYGEPRLSSSVQSASLQTKSSAMKLDKTREGKDYVKGQSIFLADSEAEALKVAEEYGTELISFKNGVGILSISRNEATKDFLLQSANEHVSDTPVYANTIFKIVEDEAVEYNDANISRQWHHTSKNLDTFKAHARGYTGQGVKVGVIDTGVCTTHEDLVKNLKKAYRTDSKWEAKDNFGHGTHCIGIIAAEANNGVGGVGVAPDADIYSYKISDGQYIDEANIVMAVNQAIEDEVDVLSMSFGGGMYPSLMKQIMDKACEHGIVCVAAAGNEGTSAPSYPACLPNVISVGASNAEQYLTDYSNYGDTVNIVAPGGEPERGIYSTWKDGKYEVICGTSMACPMVAGTAALVLSARPEWAEIRNSKRADAVRDIIMDSANGELCKTYRGNHSVSNGILNADLAIQNALGLVEENGYINIVVDEEEEEHNYTLVDEAGYYGSTLYERIAKGKSLKLMIGDKDGNVLKGLEKEAVWASTRQGEWENVGWKNRSKVKNGKIKIKYWFNPREEYTVTAEINGETLKCIVTNPTPLDGSSKPTFGFTAQPLIEKTIYHPENIWETITTDYWYDWLDSGRKVSKKLTIDAHVGDTVSMNSPNEIFLNNERQGYCYISDYNCQLWDANEISDVVRINTNKRITTIYHKFKTVMPKNNGAYTITSTKTNGAPGEIVLNKPGKLKIRFVTLDGSKKKVTLILNILP